MSNFWKKFGMDLADDISSFVGSWPFIIIQSILLSIWVIVNILKWTSFDPYPFILLNLFLSFQAAYATPMILMSSNRQADSDRKKAAKYSLVEKETNALTKESLTLISKMDESLGMIKQTLEQHEELIKEHRTIIKIDKDLKREVEKLSKKVDSIIEKIS